MLTDEKEPPKLTGKFVYSTQQLFLFYLYSKKKRLYISEAGKVLPLFYLLEIQTMREFIVHSGFMMS